MCGQCGSQEGVLSVCFSVSLSVSLSLGEEELEAPVWLARWPCSRGYHLNNTGGLMTARPRAVTVRLLSACPVSAGDVGVCRAQAERLRC